MLVGITRVRDESLIIADSIRHFLGYVDRVLLYDDCSRDRTVELAAAAGGDRIEIMQGEYWRPDRPAEETRHRHILLERALEIGAEWCLCFDADERLIGRLPPLHGDGYRFRLFDGYLTPDRCAPYTGGDLAALPRMWGPEFRDILMLFPVATARYRGLDRREPIVNRPPGLAPVFVKHYGKCLTVEHWEETCTYYSEHFPEPYKSKWQARKGRAIHHKSDFGRPLYTWSELMAHENDWVRL